MSITHSRSSFTFTKKTPAINEMRRKSSYYCDYLRRWQIGGCDDDERQDDVEKDER